MAINRTHKQINTVDTSELCHQFSEVPIIDLFVSFCIVLLVSQRSIKPNTFLPFFESLEKQDVANSTIELETNMYQGQQK